MFLYGFSRLTANYCQLHPIDFSVVSITENKSACYISKLKQEESSLANLTAKKRYCYFHWQRGHRKLYSHDVRKNLLLEGEMNCSTYHGGVLNKERGNYVQDMSNQKIVARKCRPEQ